MAAIPKSRCAEITTLSTCENPQFPNWAWRYNRNKFLSRYEPWYIRDERMPPNYRNMGVHSNFRFHPMGPEEQPRPFQALGVNYCHDAVSNRQAGFGNSAIGKVPGPAPPRLFLYEAQAPYEKDCLYKVNEIHGFSAGMSLFGPTQLGFTETGPQSVPLNPSHYLGQTLGQPVQIPGTFPHFNKPLPGTGLNPSRQCAPRKDSEEPRNLMDIWRWRHARQSHA